MVTKNINKLALQQLEHTDNPAAKVVVTPENGDRFMLSLRHAMIGCNLAVRFDSIDEQLKALFEKVATWVRDHADALDRAIYAYDQDGISLTLVQKGKPFDPDIHEAAANFDMKVADDEELAMIKFRVIVVPYSTDETISTLVDLSNATSLILS